VDCSDGTDAWVAAAYDVRLFARPYMTTLMARQAHTGSRRANRAILTSAQPATYTRWRTHTEFRTHGKEST
jgi:hypothetical protein